MSSAALAQMSKTAAVIVECPKCYEQGRLNPFVPTGSKKTEFYVAHEGLGYRWGTSVKQSETMEAVRRCYLTKATWRAWALTKMVGINVDPNDLLGQTRLM